jgi:predicted ABC-type ATPase
MRMFAGPNGSGKSTLKTVVPTDLLGHYLNPDEIEAAIRAAGEFDLSQFGTAVSGRDARDYFRRSGFLTSVGLADGVDRIVFETDRIAFPQTPINSYYASVLTDFLRRALLAAKVSFSFETVMSAPDKPELLKTAQAAGYRTYLYFVATDDPAINVARVRQRVLAGGHDVPTDKIVSRYHRTLELLSSAVRDTSRAYLFDNTGAALVWLAEVTNGTAWELKSDQLPKWFRAAVWDRLPRG